MGERIFAFRYFNTVEFKVLVIFFQELFKINPVDVILEFLESYLCRLKGRKGCDCLFLLISYRLQGLPECCGIFPHGTSAVGYQSLS